MITPDPTFRPNPDRAIYVQGEIDQALVNDLTPKIIKLKHGTLEPLSVYIDSPGGDPSLMETLLKLLLASNQDSVERCRVLTVVTSQAASAAADLLSSGDYALAYPGGSLLYHGVRLRPASLKSPLTHEWTSVLTDYLRERNNVYAMQLSEKIVGRFMFRFVLSKSRFDQIRAEYEYPDLSDLGCFLILLVDKLTPQGNKVLTQARERYERYNKLLRWIAAEENRRNKRRKKPLSNAEVEALRIKSIVEFEFKNNEGNEKWSFQSDGMNSLTDDFFLLNQYVGVSLQGTFKALASRYADFMMTPEEKQELLKVSEAERDIKKAEKVEPLFFPLWSFFMSFCYALQHGENELTAKDAYWLGLIDEVIGETSLPSLRVVSEYSPDSSQPSLPLAAPTAALNEYEEEQNGQEAEVTARADAATGA